MKTIISLCSVLLLTPSSVFTQILSLNEMKTEPITVNTGTSFTFHSKALDEERIVMIGLPDDYDKSTKKYPVYYLLDGQKAFSFSKLAVDWLSNPRCGLIPEMIVVGLHTGGDNRTRDLTPTQDRNSKAGGGADKLYQFIKEELIPFVDKNYRTYNYRVLSGASYGGVFVMHAFITDPQLFNGYISLSPSMWWDNMILLNRTKDLLKKDPNIHNKLYLSLANEGVLMRVDSLASILEKYAPKNLHWKYDRHPDEVHETARFKGTWDGLKFVMADWRYPLVDFGTNQKSSAIDSAHYSNVPHTKINLADDVLKNYSGLYLDNYGRTLILTKVDNALEFSSDKLPTLTLYPESSDKFFLIKADVQNELYLKSYNIVFEFPKADSLVMKANGKIDCVAKKMNSSPIVKVSGYVLDRFTGTYTALPQGGIFQVSKEANMLKVDEATSTFYLYPMGDNRFFAMVRGAGYEIEFTNEDSHSSAIMKFVQNGKAVLEAKKIK